MSATRRGGMHAQKYFILGMCLLCRLKDTFSKLYILATPTAPHTKLFRKTKIYLKRQLRPKVTIKGMKFENSGFPLDFMSMFQMTHEGYTPTNFFNF